MRVFSWKPAAVVGALLALVGAASAQDKTVRLGGTASLAGASTTMTLGGKGAIESAAQQDTLATRHGGGGFHGGYGGGYRGGFGGYRGGYYGGYRGGYYGGYRGYYGGFGRGYYGGYYGRRYYGGYGLYGGYGYGGYGYGGFGGYGYGGYGGGYYGGGYYGAGYFGAGYYGNGYYGNGFCSLGGTQIYVTPPTTVVQPAVVSEPTYIAANAGGGRPIPVIRVPSDGTYRYDGAPSQPVPQPLIAPSSAPVQPVIAGEEVQVSFKSPAKAAKAAYAYKAFGEK